MLRQCTVPLQCSTINTTVPNYYGAELQKCGTVLIKCCTMLLQSGTVKLQIDHPIVRYRAVNSAVRCYFSAVLLRCGSMIQCCGWGAFGPNMVRPMGS